MKFTGALLFIFLIYINPISAQKGWEIGGYIGAMHYFGELNTGYGLKDLGLSGGVIYRKNFNERVCLQSMFNIGQVKGSDADSHNSFEQKRNLSFKSMIMDVGVHLEFNFFPYYHGDREFYYTPYAFLGVAGTRFNPKTELDGENHTLRNIMTEGVKYGQFTAGISFGVGFKWDINRKWSCNAFLSPKLPWTDYIDDVSTVYPNMQSMDELGAALSDRSGIPGFAETGGQRGNSNNNDKYAVFGISLMRYFSRLECPKVSRIRGKK